MLSVRSHVSGEAIYGHLLGRYRPGWHTSSQVYSIGYFQVTLKDSRDGKLKLDSSKILENGLAHISYQRTPPKLEVSPDELKKVGVQLKDLILR
jgi:hypothetical protein